MVGLDEEVCRLYYDKAGLLITDYQRTLSFTLYSRDNKLNVIFQPFKCGYFVTYFVLLMLIFLSYLQAVHSRNYASHKYGQRTAMTL